MFIEKGAAIAALALTVSGLGAPAQAAITTFATYTADTGADNLRWRKAGATGGSLFTVASNTDTVPAVARVNFNFLTPVLAALGPLDANYSLLGTVPAGNPVATGAGFIVQSALSGGFSFTYAGVSPLVVGNTTYTTGANLLSATYTNAAIAGQAGASSGSVSASTTSTNGSTLVFSSDFLDFTGITNKGFSLNLTSIRPGLSAGASSSLNSFRTSSGGSFAADPSPPVSAVVPEPATWAMMLCGFGMTGLGLRRRRTAVRIAA